MKSTNLVLLLTLSSLVFGESNEMKKDARYNYDGNGRIIAPSSEALKKIPQNGGELWNRLVNSGDIYLSKYKGWYSVSDEAYYSDDEIVEKDGKKFSTFFKKTLIFQSIRVMQPNGWLQF